MKSILHELHSQGIPKEQALSSLFVIHQWLEKNYPVLGVVSKPILFKDVISVHSQESEERLAIRER
jgi:hypothetical protein